MVPITFDENDFQVRDFAHTDAFVATTNIAGFTVHNILIDNESSIDILFIKPFEQMNLDGGTLEPARNSLFGFGGKKIEEGNPGLFCRRREGPHRSHNFRRSQHGLPIYRNLQKGNSE